MSNPDPDFEEIRESVDEAKKPGTFKIVDVLQNRGMPKMEVTVSVDEQAAYDASVAKEKIEDLDSKYSKTKKPDDIIAEQEKWEDVRSEALERLRASSFTFHLEGISEGQRNDIFARAKKKYPIEYDQDIDLNTGKMEKTEKAIQAVVVLAAEYQEVTLFLLVTAVLVSSSSVTQFKEN